MIEKKQQQEKQDSLSWLDPHIQFLKNQPSLFL